MAKIAVICDREFFSPFDQRVWKEVISLKSTGYSIEIITPHSVSDKKELEGVKIHCIAKSKIPGITALRIIHIALRGNYDIFHCHEIDPLIYSLAIKLVKKKPIVWDCHEHYPSLLSTKIKANGKSEKNSLKETILKSLIDFCAKRTTAIISVTPPLIKYYSQLKPTFSVPNFPNKKLFNPNRRNKNILKMYAGRKVVLYQGSIKAGRGLTTLLSAMEIVLENDKNVLFLIIGGEIENSGWDEKTKLFLKKYEKNFITIGWIEHSELAPYLVHASVGIILFKPTHYNNMIGMPNKLFEYISCGLPIVSSNMPQISRVINSTKTGILVNPESPENIANSILEIVSENKNKEFKRRCNKYSKTFVWSRSSKVLLELYQKIKKKKS